MWRDQLARWRTEARERLAVDDALYARPDLAWAARCYVVSQVWLWDELLYDWSTHRFTPDRLIADAQERFGGFDGVVLWHAYPVIGIDDRNQWDFYRDVDGLGGLVDDLHAVGVKVFVDYNPWDTGTRRSRDDATELAALVAEFEIDGVFLDTLRRAAPSCSRGWPRPVRASPWRASPRFLSSDWRTIRSRGRSGSPTRRFPVSSARIGSSAATRCTTFAAGTATTLKSCGPRGSTGSASWCGRSSSACGWAGPTATPRP